MLLYNLLLQQRLQNHADRLFVLDPVSETTSHPFLKNSSLRTDVMWSRIPTPVQCSQCSSTALAAGRVTHTFKVLLHVYIFKALRGQAPQ